MARILTAISLVASAYITSAMAMPFETISKGHNSAIEEELTEVYRTRHDFERFWNRHGSNSYPPPHAPDVDFDSKMVVAVFVGMKNSGGYDVKITSVDHDVGTDELVVNFMTSEPPPGAIVTMALTQPHM